jgi:hypothetical protein
MEAAMTRAVWLRCLLVSLLASVATPPVIMVATAPDAHEPVADFRALNPEKMDKLSDREQGDAIKAIPMHRVQGWERITYWFSHPQWLRAWWQAAISWFLMFFAATAAVSFLNTRKQNGPEPARRDGLAPVALRAGLAHHSRATSDARETS